MTIIEETSAAALPDQAKVLMGQIAGYVGVRTVQMGLRAGLIQTFDRAQDGLTAEDVAAEADIDPFFAEVWCRAAFAAGVLERRGERLVLGEHLGTLLLAKEHPAHLGAMFRVLEQPELFDDFSARLGSGERTWWDRCGHEFIDAVSGTGLPFYVRLIPGGLAKVPGLVERLERGARIIDTACGSGAGLARLALTYPTSTLVGADGDAHSLERASARLETAGVRDRVELLHTPLERLDREDEFDLVVNNISMHECRDIDEVTRRTFRALKPGGWFVISDFPFPDTDEALRSVPGRILTGIQFFEAQIDDQLQPVSTYLDLLDRHGFAQIDTATLTPVHAVTFGRRP